MAKKSRPTTLDRFYNPEHVVSSYVSDLDDFNNGIEKLQSGPAYQDFEKAKSSGVFETIAKIKRRISSIDDLVGAIKTRADVWELFVTHYDSDFNSKDIPQLKERMEELIVEHKVLWDEYNTALEHALIYKQPEQTDMMLMHQ